MKPVYFLLVIVFCFSLESVSAQSSVKDIIKQLKKTENYEGMSIPGWLIRLGLKIAANDDAELNNSGLIQIASKIKHLRVASTNLDSKKYNTRAIVDNFIKTMTERDEFQEYVSVRSEDQHLKIMIQEDHDIIKNLLILSDDGFEISLVHLKTKISYDDLKSISFNQVKLDSKQFKAESI